MKSLYFAFALVVALPLATPLPATAQGPASIAEEDAEAEAATWVQRLDEAKGRLDTAKQQLEWYLKSKGEGAARRYPRGAAKAKYLEGIKTSTAEYEAARLALPEVIEEARRAGIPPGVLDSYETAAADAVPVTDITDFAAAQANPGDDDVEQAAAGDEGVDGDVEDAQNTDTPEEDATNTDTQEEDPGPQSDDDDF
jgi:hypothetical protein